MKTSLFLSTALTALLVTGMASAAKKTYVAAEMSGEKEKPTANDGAATGSARLTYDDTTKKLCGTITFTPSSFTASAAHIHEGNADSAGDVLIPLGSGTGSIKVNATLTEAQAAGLDSDVYVNVHSDTYPDGAMRDQLVADSDQDSPEECDGDDADGGASSSSSSSSSSSGGADGGTSGAAGTPASTDADGCNATGGGTGSGLAIAAGLGVALMAASRKRKKA